MKKHSLSDNIALILNDEIQFCRENICYFVESYCKIEDRDKPVPVIPFKLWEAQKKALLSISSHRLNIILKARQLGLSWLVLCYCAHRMIFYPGSSVVALSRTETEAAELVRRLSVILSNMPEFVSAGKNNRSRLCALWHTSHEISLTHSNGAESIFKAFPSAANSVRSFTANVLVLDEWAFQQQAREIWTAAFPAVNRPSGGQVIGLSTIAKGTLFEEIFTQKNDFNKIFLPWNADPRRTAEWYESTKKQLGALAVQEYPASVEEALSSHFGCFFPELREHIHLRPAQEIQPYYRKYVALDYGLDMLAAGWYYIDNKGFARGYKEVNQSGLIVSEAAKLLLEVNNGEKIHQWFAPPDLWNRNRDTGKSTADIFRDCGIVLTKVSNNREQGWLALKEFLRPIALRNEHSGEEYLTAKLTFDEGAMPTLWRCMREIQTDKQNPRDTAITPHELTHAPDALRYFVCGCPITANKQSGKFKKQNRFSMYFNE